MDCVQEHNAHRKTARNKNDIFKYAEDYTEQQQHNNIQKYDTPYEFEKLNSNRITHVNNKVKS